MKIQKISSFMIMNDYDIILDLTNERDYIDTSIEYDSINLIKVKEYKKSLIRYNSIIVVIYF